MLWLVSLSIHFYCIAFYYLCRIASNLLNYCGQVDLFFYREPEEAKQQEEEEAAVVPADYQIPDFGAPGIADNWGAPIGDQWTSEQIAAPISAAPWPVEQG